MIFAGTDPLITALIPACTAIVVALIGYMGVKGTRQRAQALRRIDEVHAEVVSPNGMRTGAMVDFIMHEQVAHALDDTRRFAEIYRALDLPEDGGRKVHST